MESVGIQRNSNECSTFGDQCQCSSDERGFSVVAGVGHCSFVFAVAPAESPSRLRGEQASQRQAAASVVARIERWAKPLCR